MNLITIFLAGSLLLGVFAGPLAVAMLTRALSGEKSKQIGDWAFGIGLKSVWRPALTFNAADELTLKRRAYDEDHDEQTITFGGMLGGVERTLFDPQGRLHDFFGTPFGFVDERFGIIFDARDATVARELMEAQEAGVYEHQVERGQQLVESVRAVFELPGDHDGVNLSDVWALVGGSFDSQLVRKIHEYYQKAQAPKADTTALRQLLVPVGTFIAIVLLGYFAAGQGGGGGGGGGAATNESTIEFGMTLLMASTGAAASKRNRRDVVVSVVGSILALGLVGGAYYMFPTWTPVFGIPLPLGVWAVIMMGIGVAVMPLVAGFFGRSLGPIGLLLGKLYITIGLLAYDTPVITQVSQNEYALREYDDHDWDTKPEFYRFAMTRIGVGHSNDVDVWGDNVTVSPVRVDTMGSDVPGGVSDGGAKPGAPIGYSVTQMIQHEDIYGFVPDDVDRNATYIRSDLTTGQYIEAGQNRRLMTSALESAKEKYGGGQQPLDDKVIMGATMGAMLIGAVFDYLVFF